jgi:hypothetical protein
MSRSPLQIYLADHLAGSVAGLELANACRARELDTPLGHLLADLGAEIEAEQEVLRELLRRSGGDAHPAKQAAAWLGEKLSRLKLNNPLGHDRDLERFEALEGLLLGVRGKLALWHALHETLGQAALTGDPRGQGFDFAELARRAERQLREIETHRLAAARRALSPNPE